MLRAQLIALSVLTMFSGCGGPSARPAKALAPAPAAPAASAPEATIDAVATTADDTAGAPVMWQVVVDGKVSYLLGTIHMGVDPICDLHPIVWDRFDTAKSFIMEADLESGSFQELSKLMLYPAGETLEDKLTPKQWKRLVKETKKSPEQLRPMRPWFLVITLLQEAFANIDARPMDPHFQKVAKERGLELHYLETVSEQLTMISSVIDVEMLQESLDGSEEFVGDPSAIAAETTKMIETYKSGTISYEQFSAGTTELERRFQKQLLEERNLRWVPELETRLREGETFVAVGAGHLLGDKGVVELLRARGMDIQRVAVPANDNAALAERDAGCQTGKAATAP